jgi:hypothetical protein
MENVMDIVMGQLTAEEKKWLGQMQRLINKQPVRLGLYTVGDPNLSVFDRTKVHLFDEDRDMPMEVHYHEAHLGTLHFKVNVHGVCG